MTHTLEIDGIQLEFDGRTILSGIYLKCETGKITGLLGKKRAGQILPDEDYLREYETGKIRSLRPHIYHRNFHKTRPVAIPAAIQLHSGFSFSEKNLY